MAQIVTNDLPLHFKNYFSKKKKPLACLLKKTKSHILISKACERKHATELTMEINSVQWQEAMWVFFKETKTYL